MLTPRKFLKGGTSPQLPSFPRGVWCSHTNAAEVSLATLWLSLCPPSPPWHPRLSLHRDLLPRARPGPLLKEGPVNSILFCCSYEQRFVILTSRNIPRHGGTVHLEHCLSCCVAVPLPAFMWMPVPSQWAAVGSRCHLPVPAGLLLPSVWAWMGGGLKVR